MTTPPIPKGCPMHAAGAADARDAEPAETSCPRPDSVVRWGLVVTGFCCLGLGGVGVVVPGLPTTIFLIVASWCFTRSCPWLDERMRASRLFAPYVQFLDPDTPMPMSVRVRTLALLWLFAGGSAVVLVMRDLPLAAGLTTLAAMVGTVAIMRWRRGGTDAMTADAVTTRSA